ncbi:CAP domain-containing protein [Oricola thermophila]|uniref:CAP domain-containing protein n=1 Tax=Oricola thermophila TaxID=2742145 RepID=A0A6N1VJD1_9HYPH|nr:CAP domain-containing protein [Oricola thermophila]QKV19329.1 CAP domain-containing protein [Oricola thermophila]
MIGRRTLLLGALSAGLLSGCARIGAPGLSLAGEGAIVTGKTLAKVNALRREAGKPVLVADRALGRSALDHARYMARKGRMSHDHFARRMRRHGVSLPAAENVAEGWNDVDSMFRSFEVSPKHRANMLGDFRRMGVAVARDRNGRAYWVMQLSG